MSKPAIAKDGREIKAGMRLRFYDDAVGCIDEGDVIFDKELNRLVIQGGLSHGGIPLDGDEIIGGDGE